jgi:hypothetical protein
MDDKLRGNIDQWTGFTIITMYNSYFKPMDRARDRRAAVRAGGAAAYQSQMD